jgi:hypothetical protein
LRLALLPSIGAAAFLLACAIVEVVVYARKPAAYAHRATARNDSKDTIFDASLGTCFADSEYLPFALIPGRYTLPGGETITINSQGYRGRELSLRKPPGTTRILFVGDSFIYGYGADDEYTIPRLVEKTLQNRFAGVEVINAGFHGSCPMQYELYLRKEGFALAPDFIVFAVYPGNDLSDVYYNFVQEYDDHGLTKRITDGLVCFGGRRYHALLPGWLYHAPILDRSVLWYYLNRRAYAGLRGRQQRGITKEDSQEFFRQPTLRLIQEVRHRNIGLSAWVIAGRETVDPPSCPWLRKDKEIEEEAETRRFVLKCLHETGVDCIDLAPALAAAHGDDVCLPRDGHLNARGNALVAEAGASHLLPTVAALTHKAAHQALRDRSALRGTAPPAAAPQAPEDPIPILDSRLTAQMPPEDGDSEPAR